MTELEEEIRLAKQHLDVALARARNRDSLREEWEESAMRWINPPAYHVVDLDKPKVWQSLERVPVGVVVQDADGDLWKIKPDGRLRVKSCGSKWRKANLAGYPFSAWDHYAPFTEVQK